VIGLCCAFELSRGGAEVVVFERAKAGGGASFGNTGWITPSLTGPLPGPGVMGAGLRGMLRGGGPLAIRPSLDPTFVRWLLGFRRSCSRTRFEGGLKALLALNARTLQLFDEYLAAGVEFELYRSGLLIVAHTRAGLRPYTELFRKLAALGYDGGIAELGAQPAAELEPALDPLALAGGLHARVDGFVRPETLSAALAAHLVRQSVQIREDVEVLGIEDGKELRMRTDDGDLAVDRVVLAAGVSSPTFLAALGVRVPLVPARGYSVTFAAGAARPGHALYLAEAKVGISAYEDSVRVAGVFELGYSDPVLDRRRLAAMLATVRPYFAAWDPEAETPLFEWAGLRPATSDGLPLIGRAPREPKVFIATGHGMLGVTLGPATAAALAPLVLEDRAVSELEPFRPDRRV
jgi:D-amino-acid dehydrogenase